MVHPGDGTGWGLYIFKSINLPHLSGELSFKEPKIVSLSKVRSYNGRFNGSMAMASDLFKYFAP